MQIHNKDNITSEIITMYDFIFWSIFFILFVNIFSFLFLILDSFCISFLSYSLNWFIIIITSAYKCLKSTVSCDSDIGRTADYQKNQVCACCSIPYSFKNELKFGDVHMHFTVRILSLHVIGDLFLFLN